MAEKKQISLRKRSETPAVSSPVKIRKYYDSIWKVWVIYPIDVNGYQTDNSFYAHTKKEATELEKELKEKLCI